MNLNALDPRKRIDERALEKEEEDYFNEDRYAFFFWINACVLFIQEAGKNLLPYYII